MPGRILIADDVATNRIILKVKLRAASYDVSQAVNQQELLQRSQEILPDLIIMDGGFQSDRAIDICQELQENKRTANIPIMILESDYTPADRLAALHSGACEVLTKPVDDTVLLARVRNSMRVRSVQEELLLRESTAIELGFQETAAPFQHPAKILVVNGPKMQNLEWQKAFEAKTPCTIQLIGHTNLLDTIAKKNMSPDIVLLPSSIDRHKDGLFLLAELRSHPTTRHSAIIVTDDDDSASAAITALDMGANEVVSAQTPPAEFAFRLKRILSRKMRSDQLRNTLADGLRMAVTDPLTGLFNRRYAFPHMSRIAKKSVETSSPFAVMVLDLDRFKRVNDSHGHGAGDLVLKEVANRLKANVRSVDLIARIGGEEFLVVMPDTGLTAARVAAERLRHVTGATPIAIPGETGSVCVTTSIGVSIGGIDTRFETSMEAMVERADQALLGAKSTGRNQVIFERSAA
ncbi:MAG: diguanylate cyclase [Paracoccaceae bacterium]